MRFLLTFTMCFIFFIFVCCGEGSSELVLFDFESDAELDRFYWKCHTLFSLSDEHITHGARSLRLELYPSAYPGLVCRLEKGDWRRYKALCFDIYNPEEKEICLTVRIDDQKEYLNYDDRYSKSFSLEPGLNRITIPLNTLLTSGTKRNLDQKRISRLLIFSAHPQNKVVLFVDYIRLV